MTARSEAARQSGRGALRAIWRPAFLAVSLLLYMAALHQGRYRYETFAPLQWQSLVGCAVGALPPAVQAPEGAVGTFGLDAAPASGLCESRPFALPAQAEDDIYVLEFEVAGPTGAPPPSLEFLKARSGLPAHLKLDAVSIQPGGWYRVRYRYDAGRELVPAPEQGGLIVRIKREQTTSEQAPWLGLRSKVNFYRLQPGLLGFSLPGALIAPLLCLVIVSLVLMLRRLTAGLHPSFFTVLLAVVIGVHLRTPLFYFWDEWHVLERFLERGAAGAIYTHNEHFLPLYFFYYFLQSTVFGDAYLLLILSGLLLHSVNCWLLARFLARLSGLAGAGSSRGAKVLALLYALSPLHGEVLQWAFEQSVLLAQLVSLLGFHAVLSYCESRRMRFLFGIAIAALSAPLFFGNTFNFLPQCLLLACALVASGSASLRSSARRVLAVGVSALIGVACAAGLYLLNTDGAGHGVKDADLGHNPLESALYAIVGGELGTVLRGLGLFPSLEASAPALLLGEGGELQGAALGFLASLALLALSWGKHGARKALAFWLLGQGMILSAFALPALGRWHLGLAQSLSLRYQYGALVGLAVMVLPLFGQAAHASPASFAVPNRWRSFLGTLLLSAHLGAALAMGYLFRYFTDQAVPNEIFVDELRAWSEVMANAPGGWENYEARGTTYVGLQPLMPLTLTPGRHPSEIYRVLNYLNGERYALPGAVEEGRSLSSDSDGLR